MASLLASGLVSAPQGPLAATPSLDQGVALGAKPSRAGGGEGVTASCNLASHLWKKRPLVVFAPSAEDPRLRRQRQETAAARALGGKKDDLDLVLIVVTEDAPQCGAEDRQKLYRSLSLLPMGLPPMGLRTGDFRVLLIGKDGGVKLSSRRVLKAETLAATIEAMPMRREEKARKGR